MLGALVFLGGHGLLLIRTHNWFYGTGLKRRAIDLIQYAHALALVAVPAGFWLLFGFDLQLPWEMPRSAPLSWCAFGYVCLCWVIACAFPLLTLRRLLRPRPAALESNHTRTVDIAQELGYRPIGRTGPRRIAQLPWNEVFQLDLTEKTLRLPRLPAAWDGLSVLHFSDVHFTGSPDRDYFRRVIDLCAAWDPDLVAFTGDLVDTPTHHRWIVPLFGRLKARCGRFAILGNHDFDFDTQVLCRRLRRAGLHVLGHGWTQTEVRGLPLLVIGHEGPWRRPEPDLSACPEGPFRLCLSHTPDNIAWARRQGIDLMLAGHVHGGQIRLPLFGSVLIPSRYGRRYDCGTFDEPPTVLHVSRGLSGEHPVRYNCRPEVTKLVLRPAGNG